MNIFAIGDSHCIFFYDSKNIKNHWVGWGGMPVTMYQFIEQGLPLYNIVERLPPGDICDINIKENDIVLFYYGWNDVQRNVKKNSINDSDYIEMIDKLVNNYIEIIKAYSNGNKYKIRPIVSCVYPITINTKDSIIGTNEERIQYTSYMNYLLQIKCIENNIPFFDIYNILHNNNIISQNVVDDDGVHLDRKNTDLREIIEKELFEICKLHYNEII